MTNAPAEPRLTVLIADDDEESRALYRFYLSGLGWRVFEADAGGHVLPLVAETRPDVIVMDLALPEIDGWTLTRRLRLNPATTDLPVVIVSAHARPAERARAVAAGCSAYLTKPCLPERLAQELRSLVNQRPKPAPS